VEVIKVKQRLCAAAQTLVVPGPLLDAADVHLVQADPAVDGFAVRVIDEVVLCLVRDAHQVVATKVGI
jgi:hypothetical protein